MVNEVECWQRIISMTSKGVVISRCFSPSCHGLRVVSHPRVIVLIQAVPSAPASHLHLTLPSVLPLPRISPSLSSAPVSTSPLPKHNFRRQTKRVGVAYNEARSFVSSAFSCYPSSCPARRCPCRRLNLNSDDPKIHKDIINNYSTKKR